MKPFSALMILMLAASASANTLKWHGFWGKWRNFQSCGHGSYVNGFSNRVEGNQKGGDDTAMNAIRMTCTNGRTLTPHGGLWGGWGHSARCPGGYTGAQVRIERQQGDGDDTALNCVKLWCTSTNSWSNSNCGPWGDWHTGWCDKGQKICGVNIRLEDSQRGGDDTAMNGIELRCC